MADWANFFLYMISQTVQMFFRLDLGNGFTLGDVEVALMIIGLVASAFVIRIATRGIMAHDGYETWKERQNN